MEMVVFPKLLLIRVLSLAWLLVAALPMPGAAQGSGKLDRFLEERLDAGGRSRVIIVCRTGAQLEGVLKAAGAKLGRKLKLVDGQVLDVPNQSLRTLAEHGDVWGVHLERETRALLDKQERRSGHRTCVRRSA